jgi:hypothetical protein
MLLNLQQTWPVFGVSLLLNSLMKGIASAVIRVWHIPMLERHLRRGGRGIGAAFGRNHGFLKSPPPLYRYLGFAAINVPQVLCERDEMLMEACSLLTAHSSLALPMTLVSRSNRNVLVRAIHPGCVRKITHMQT